MHTYQHKQLHVLHQMFQLTFVKLRRAIYEKRNWFCSFHPIYGSADFSKSATKLNFLDVQYLNSQYLWAWMLSSRSKLPASYLCRTMALKMNQFLQSIGNLVLGNCQKLLMKIFNEIFWHSDSSFFNTISISPPVKLSTKQFFTWGQLFKKLIILFSAAISGQSENAKIVINTHKSMFSNFCLPETTSLNLSIKGSINSPMLDDLNLCIRIFIVEKDRNDKNLINPDITLCVSSWPLAWFFPALY